jgi:hypothetical protein
MTQQRGDEADEEHTERDQQIELERRQVRQGQFGEERAHADQRDVNADPYEADQPLPMSSARRLTGPARRRVMRVVVGGGRRAAERPRR